MSTLIVLYNYNKYYNRIVKKLDTFAEYEALITPVGDNPAPLKGFKLNQKNFDYQDGVFASHIINIPRDYASFYKLEQPDYLIQAENYVENNVTYTKLTRWYVLEVTKQRGCQFELSLKRDLLADFYSEIIEAPVFIERGQSQNISDPAIFNKEGFTFNQIKRGELLLNDNKYSGNKGGWIVGYLARGQNESDIVAQGQEEPPTEGYIDFDTLPAKIQAMINAGKGFFFDSQYFEFDILADFYSVYDNQFDDNINCGFVVMNYQSRDIEGIRALRNFIFLPQVYSAYLKFKSMSYYDWQSTNWEQNSAISYLISEYKRSLNYSEQFSIKQEFETQFSNRVLSDKILDTEIDDIMNYHGIIYRKDGNYYRLNIEKTINELNSASSTHYHSYEHEFRKEYTKAQIKANVDGLASAVNRFLTYPFVINEEDGVTDSDDTQTKTSIILRRIPSISYNLQSLEVTTQKATVTITSNRNALYDAPYDIFCMPLANVDIVNGSMLVKTTSGNVALPVARDIALKGTSSRVYDIQLLPYCPVPEFLNSQGKIDIHGLTLHRDYEYITETVGQDIITVGILLFAKTCKGTFDLEIKTTDVGYDYLVPELENATTRKVKTETELIRFVSPNFASMYEVNAQKNDGILLLNVDYFYKPYSPYIHVAPYFSGLYGEDYNDPKGLICSGDFSIATAASQWESYQIQNKNYELIFDRQIQNLDINNSISYDQQKLASGISVASSALAGIAGGAVSGLLATGNPVGAVVGAAVGGAASAGLSAFGRQKDLEYLSKSQKEARSYMEDMYTYQLGNIQALPNTLTKVSAFTANNKIFPFIEFYDCTDEEKEALRNKLKYNGMTIMRIGKIADFRYGPEHYVQGQLIRLEGISEDSHVVAEIAKEIKEGAYFYGYDSIGS